MERAQSEFIGERAGYSYGGKGALSVSLSIISPSFSISGVDFVTKAIEDICKYKYCFPTVYV